MGFRVIKMVCVLVFFCCMCCKWVSTCDVCQLKAKATPGHYEEEDCCLRGQEEKSRLRQSRHSRGWVLASISVGSRLSLEKIKTHCF